MKKTIRIICLTLLCSGGWAAGVPTKMNYQGRLFDAASLPVNNPALGMTFRIFDSLAAGTQLWSEAQVVVVAQGLFNVELGAVTPLSQSVFAGSQAFLEMQITGDPSPLIPRTPLVTAPYAFRAGFADSATVTAPLSLSSSSASNVISGIAYGGGTGNGIYGEANGSPAYGVRGKNQSTSGASAIGVFGETNSFESAGIFGSGNNNYGVVGESTGGIGVVALGAVSGLSATASAAGGQAVLARGTGSGSKGLVAQGVAIGVSAVATGAGGRGLYAAGSQYGVYAFANSPTASAIFATNRGGNIQAEIGRWNNAVYGYSTGAPDVASIYGDADGGSNAVEGYASGAGSGVYGQGDSGSSVGVRAMHWTGGVALAVTGHARFDAGSTSFTSHVDFTGATVTGLSVTVPNPLHLNGNAAFPGGVISATNTGNGYGVAGYATQPGVDANGVPALASQISAGVMGYSSVSNSAGILGRSSVTTTSGAGVGGIGFIGVVGFGRGDLAGSAGGSFESTALSGMGVSARASSGTAVSAVGLTAVSATVLDPAGLGLMIMTTPGARAIFAAGAANFGESLANVIQVNTINGGTAISAFNYATSSAAVYGISLDTSLPSSGASGIGVAAQGPIGLAAGSSLVGGIGVYGNAPSGVGVYASGAQALKVSGNAQFDGVGNTVTFASYVSFTGGTNLVAGGVSAPLTLSQTASTASLSAINFGGGHAVDALANSDNAAALRGRNVATLGNPIAILGESSATGNGIGVLGTTDPIASTPIINNEVGVYGYTSGQIAVYGRNAGAGGYKIGVFGLNSSNNNTGAGVIGENNSPLGVGIYGYNQAGSGVPIGIRGEVTAGSVTGGAGVSGEFLGVAGTGNQGFGVFGVNKATNNAGAGVFGDSNSPYGAGVYARNINVGPALVAGGYSVAVSATADPYNGLGVYATGQTGVAAVSGVLPIYALNTAGGGFITAIRAEVQGTNTGVQALNTMGGNMGSLAGPVDIAHFASGVGVQGLAAAGGGTGVHGISDNGPGVRGETSNTGLGAFGPAGVRAVNLGTSAFGSPATALDVDGGVSFNAGRVDPVAGSLTILPSFDCSAGGTCWSDTTMIFNDQIKANSLIFLSAIGTVFAYGDQYSAWVYSQGDGSASVMVNYTNPGCCYGNMDVTVNYWILTPR